MSLTDERIDVSNATLHAWVQSLNKGADRCKQYADQGDAETIEDVIAYITTRQPCASCDEKDAEIEVLKKEFNFRSHLKNQREFSEKTFGPGARAEGVVDHITKELAEILAQPDDLEEWIDVVILALDGAWRAGYSPDQIIEKLVAKQKKNESRKWPDWRTAEPGKAIEHID